MVKKRPKGAATISDVPRRIENTSPRSPRAAQYQKNYSTKISINALTRPGPMARRIITTRTDANLGSKVISFVFWCGRDSNPVIAKFGRSWFIRNSYKTLQKTPSAFFSEAARTRVKKHRKSTNKNFGRSRKA